MAANARAVDRRCRETGDFGMAKSGREEMDGFADLPWADQKVIVDMRENLIAMDGAANASKGDRSWSAWSQASNYYDASTIRAMAKRESDVRALIESEIKRRVAALGTTTL